MTDQIIEYRRRFDSFLQIIANNLEDMLREYLVNLPRIDRISARAKEPEKFEEKANRKKDDNSLIYNFPLTEIQDQIGARIIVFYRNDIEPVEEIINNYFQHIEEKEITPESNWEFGYFGKHFILALPMDVVPNGIGRDEVPHFFELQIKTLFQHAWSEANHDLGYKPINKLNNDQQRKLAFAAAQAWGADQIFQSLYKELKN
ncbi:MAG: GTP pyrophosphokinase [Promethearchaeota archaeon]